MNSDDSDNEFLILELNREKTVERGRGAKRTKSTRGGRRGGKSGAKGGSCLAGGGRGLAEYRGGGARRGRGRAEHERDGAKGGQSVMDDGRGSGRGTIRGRRSGIRGGRDSRRSSSQSSRKGDNSDSGLPVRGRGGRSVRGQGRGGARSTHIHRLELSDLSDISKCEPTEVVARLQEDLKGFQQSLNSCSKIPERSRDYYIRTVIAVLVKVCEAEEKDATSILAEFLSDRCAEFHMLLKAYIASKSFEQSGSAEAMLTTLHSLFKFLLDNLPTSAWLPLPYDDLAVAVDDLLLLDVKLRTDIAQLIAQRDDIKRQQTEKKRAPALMDETSWDNTLYRTIPIWPTMDEICTNRAPQLRSNIVTGAYSGWEHYYDIQFRLLREDFLAPLRRGVAMFCSSERKGRLTDINVYHDVQLIKPEFTENGICYEVKFNVSHFRQRRSWEHSKRLIYGSLLCFSPQQDNFSEIVHFATVIDRKPEELNQGIFHVQFENGLEMFQHIRKSVFTVIESKAYFEASRHILQSLQRAEINTMPFTRYLIANQPTPVKMPKYLNHTEPRYDIRWLYSEDKFIRSRHVIDISNDFEWPSEDDIELDRSQIEAIKMALRQEISVIQGPPGTGKTYIGYKIVQTLLQNRSVWDPNQTSPILVMCYTNHALDQFLQGIIHHKIYEDESAVTPNIVRIGGRSKCEEIRKCSLWNARGRSVPFHILNAVRNEKEAVIAVASNIPWHSFQRVSQDPINEFIVSEEGMMRLRHVIHPSHFYQLTLFGEEVDKIGLSLEVWLGLWEKEYSQRDPKAQQAICLDKPNAEAPSIENQPTVNQENVANDEIEDDDAEEMIHVTGEAEIEEANRRLDDHGYQQFQLKEGVEDTGKIDDAFSKHIQQHAQQEQSPDHDQMDHENKPIVKYVKKESKQVQKILQAIRHCEPFDPEEERDIVDISKLNIQERYRLLRLWVSKYQRRLGEISQQKVTRFEEACQNYRLAQQDIDRIALEKADVIGMTTTGAAKYQHILHLVKPKIVIVEEAAEVLESHIVSALNAGTEHLILIGDHKQLRPKPNEYELAKRHKLEVSLFERLLRNGLPHATLLIQHRMRPQIAGLVCPFIYETLINHETVMKYENVRSCDKNMFFFHHTNPEKEIEYLLSHSNDKEAEYVVSLCRHLLKQNYSPSQITILTAYTGQLLSVRNQMPRKEFDGVQIVNIDNFQGEENDIIILSLVRNNSSHNVGFLREENRVCVALSRARMGFYCFGNFDMLRSEVPVWEIILSHVSKQGCLGSAFPLHCHNHPNVQLTVQEPGDFSKYFPNGGCTRHCQYRLNCGHQCKQLCHVTDPDHKEYKCKQTCERKCANGEHMCKAPCFKKCPPCTIQVEKELPMCGHKQMMHCYQDPEIVPCSSPCSKLCSNGLHNCQRKCSENCGDCTYLVSRVMPRCGHLQDMYCYQNPAREKCLHPCTKSCTDGHPCTKACGEECGRCMVKVKKTLPKCGHQQSMHCYQDPSQFKCQKKCEKIYSCGHRCPKLCYDDCDILCQIPVDKILPKCSHSNKIPCYIDPGMAKCTQRCERNLACGHSCKRLCGELCALYECKELKPLTLPCTHVISVSCNDHLKTRIRLLQGREYECSEPCKKLLPCGHQCRNKCNDQCTTHCKTKVQYTCPKGDHTSKLHCYLVQDPTLTPSCEMRPCRQKLRCGHSCTKKCGEQCTSFCEVSLSRKCLCGHKHDFKCGDTLQKCLCKEKCSEVLQCGHKCPGKCGDCFTKRIHSPCVHQVQVNRFCGHFASLPCVGLLDKCTKTCQLSACPHRKDLCSHMCFEDCTAELCTEECIVECPHGKCSRTCGEVCSKASCTESCTKTLKCRHHCPGLCGEKCLQYCMSCNAKKFHEKVKGIRKKAPTAPLCVQLECGHAYSVQYLDQRFKSRLNQDELISPLLCPACSKPLISSAHLWKSNRERMQDIKKVKEKVFSSAEVINAEEFFEIQYKVGRGKHTIKLDIQEKNVEEMLAMKLLYSADQFHKQLETLHLCDGQLIQSADDFASAVAKILTETKGKLSLQLISDIASELFRFKLLALTEEITSGAAQNCRELRSTRKLLQEMKENHKLRLVFEMYQEHSNSLLRIYGSYISNPRMYEEEAHTPPNITKGDWYKCHRVGHIYFVPAKYRDKEPLKCTFC